MNNIEVKVLNVGHSNPEGMMMFLAHLTQRGHSIDNMDNLVNMYNKDISNTSWKSSKSIAQLPHGTIKRFAPITVAIVGASRRFLAQARTHSVGLDFVSASLQYSDYSNSSQFCIPYDVLCKGGKAEELFITSCKASMNCYKLLIENGISNDSAGYLAPQALRNILIIQGNIEAWDNFIRRRICKRNTAETAYVTALIWDKLYNIPGGDVFFGKSGPDCLGRGCREGKMCCGKPLNKAEYDNIAVSPALLFIRENFPKLF